jgi:flagellar biosynthesis protein FlhF
MLVKKFEASSLEKALALVKQELGPNALILSSNQVHRRWFKRPLVEVTAAFERKAAKSPTEFDEKALMEVFPHRRYEDVPQAKPEKDKPVNRYVSDEKPEKDPRKNQLPGRKVTDDKFETFFLEKGFSKETSREMSRKLVLEYPSTELSNPAFLSRVREKLLVPSIRVYGKEKVASRTSWVAVGPAGSGKTSLLVKLALWGKEQGRSVCLVSQDRKKASGAQELANYARLLRVPFAVEPSKVSGKQLLIDTPAMKPGDEEWAKDCERICEGRSTVLVLDSTMRLSEMLHTVEAASRFSLAAVAFTKCDLAHELGVIPEVISAARLPLFGLSTTDSFREPFHFPEADELARRVFGKEAA